MRTAVLLSRGEAPSRIVEAELDEPRPDEVVVRIEAVGVCHTDLRTRDGLGDLPAVLGHEGCGTVQRRGADVEDLEIGDRVVISFASCGDCRPCRAGQPAYCRKATSLNGSGARPDGSATIRVAGRPVYGAFFGQSSFAAAALTRAASCVPIGDAPAHVAAPLGCGFLTGAGAVLNVLRPGPGDRLLVVGAGGVGAAAVLAARSENVDVVVAEPVAARRDLVRGVGADAVVSLDEPVAPVTHALDTTGDPRLIAQALRLLEPRGLLTVVGLGPARADIGIRDLMLRGLQLRGCVEGDAEPAVLIPELLRRWRAGTLPLDRLVTAYGLGDFDQAVADQHAGLVVKPVLLPAAFL